MDAHTLWLGSHASFCEFESRKAKLDTAMFSESPPPDREGEGYSLHGNVAVIDISGPLVNSESVFNDLFGLTSYTRIRNNLVAAATDPDVGEIVLNIDSGGGTPNGLPDVSDLIRRIGAAIPVTAFTGGTMASAAYWLGSAAEKLYAGPTAMVGSIGVIATMMDRTQQLANEGIRPVVLRAGDRKALANPYEPITDEVKAEVQGQIDHLHGVFKSAVQQHRGMTAAQVDKLADGTEFIGDQAVQAGLVDGITTLDALVGGLQARYDSRNSNRKDSPMAKKALLTERQVAMIAEGVDPKAAIEAAPAETTDLPGETTSEATEAATQAAAAQGDGTTAPSTPLSTEIKVGTGTGEGTGEGDLVTFLRAELTAKSAEITQLSVQLAEQTRELNAIKACEGAMKSIVAASISRMQIGLGGKAADLARLSSELLIEQHTQVAEQFAKTFPVGGVAAISAADPEETSAPATQNTVQRAALRAVKTK